MDTPDPTVIQAIAAELQDNPVAAARAAELSTEVGRLNAAVLRDAALLRFSDEPASFASALEEAAR